jgi:hypothetical protein
MEQFIAAQM